MKFFLFRNGDIITSGDPGVAEPSDYVEINGDENSFRVIPLDTGVFIVREGNETTIQLIIFKQGGRCKPRTLTFNGVPANISIREILQVLFAKLLSFDNNRLATRDRNIAITIIRSLLPDVVRGEIERTKGNLKFYLYNNLLSVFSMDGGKALIRLGYTSFSRVIKDRL